MGQRRGGRKRRKVCYFTQITLHISTIKIQTYLRNSFLSVEKSYLVV